MSASLSRRCRLSPNYVGRCWYSPCADVVVNTGKMMLQTSSRRYLIPLCVFSLFLFDSLLSSTTLAVTSPEAAARRDDERGWTTTTAAAPRRRQPVPLDCSEGLERCRGNLNCRTLLDTLDRVCDQSSTYITSNSGQPSDKIKKHHVRLIVK